MSNAPLYPEYYRDVLTNISFISQETLDDDSLLQQQVTQGPTLKPTSIISTATSSVTVIAATVVTIVVVCFMCSVAGYLYYQEKSKAAAYQKWLDNYVTNGKSAASFPPIPPGSPSSFGVMLPPTSPPSNPNGMVGDSFESQNPAFGQVKRASALPIRKSMAPQQRGSVAPD